MRFHQKRHTKRRGGGGIHGGGNLSDGGNRVRGRVRQSREDLHPDDQMSPWPKPRVSYWLKCILANTFPTSKTTFYNYRLPLS